MFLIITKKKWNDENFRLLNKKFIISSKLNFGKIKKLNPEIIFFIHWSKIIPKKFFKIFYVFNFMPQIYQNIEEVAQFKIKFLMVIKIQKFQLLKLMR